MFFNILWYFSFNPIKQVNYSGLYITDDTNTAKFPEPTGRFSTINLFHRGHYEVHGDPDQLPPTPAVPVPFSFTRRPSPSASASTETPPRAGIPRASGMFHARLFQRLLVCICICNWSLLLKSHFIIYKYHFRPIGVILRQSDLSPGQSILRK